MAAPPDAAAPTDEELLERLQALQIAFDSGDLSPGDMIQNAAQQLVLIKALRQRGVDEVRIFTALKRIEPVKRP
jgi:hypothetical protein